MKIKSIEIRNFRNYEKLNINFNDNINIFIGNNGEGKTNILESIYVLAITKSHRAYIDKNLITTNKNLMKINGKIETLNGNKTLELLMNDEGKRVSVNKVVQKKVSDYISNMSVILFSPDDLELVKDSPSIRRKFLNIEIGQFDNKYLYYLNDYNELLRTRNEYLKTISVDKYDKNYLDIINNQLCDKAVNIYNYRNEYINNLNKYLKKISKDLSDKEVKLKYINNIDSNNYNEIKEKLLNKLNENLKREIILGSTLYGPHKDDFEIYIDELDARNYGSQGQQRMCVLCIKFAELEVFNEKKKEYPILLLDDMFSELDNIKKNKIVEYLNNNMQVFITSTDINDIDKKLLKNATIYNIRNGNIIN